MSDDIRDDLTPFPREPIDPVRMAQRDLKKALPKRFYTDVATAPADGGFGLLLDGRPVRTPGKALLAVPTAALAEVLAEEWRAQSEWIEPDTMPLTRLANSAIDGVAHHVVPTIDDVAKFAETDLVCYRAGDPAALVEAQAAAWDPMLAFARNTIGARLICAEGVMYVPQSEPALAAMRESVETIAYGRSGALRLAALSVMTSLTGSVVVALAVVYGRLSPEEAWATAHVDEDYQMRLWGADSEAMGRRDHRWRDMYAATQVFTLGDKLGDEEER